MINKFFVVILSIIIVLLLLFGLSKINSLFNKKEHFNLTQDSVRSTVNQNQENNDESSNISISEFVRGVSKVSGILEKNVPEKTIEWIKSQNRNHEKIYNLENQLLIKRLDLETANETIKRSEDQLANSKLGIKDVEITITSKDGARFLKLVKGGESSVATNTFKPNYKSGKNGVYGWDTCNKKYNGIDNITGDIGTIESNIDITIKYNESCLQSYNYNSYNMKTTSMTKNKKYPITSTNIYLELPLDTDELERRLIKAKESHTEIITRGLPPAISNKTESADDWCVHAGSVHQLVPGAGPVGRICHDESNRGIKGVTGYEWVSKEKLPCELSPEANWPGCGQHKCRFLKIKNSDHYGSNLPNETPYAETSHDQTVQPYIDALIEKCCRSKNCKAFNTHGNFKGGNWETHSKNIRALDSHPEIMVHDVSPTQYQKPIDFYVKL